MTRTELPVTELPDIPDILLNDLKDALHIGWQDGDQKWLAYINLLNKADYTLHQMKQEPIYRIYLGPTQIEVDCYDLIENFAPELEDVYTSLEEMPDWVKERIAVLMVLDPAQINEPIEGVGRRINKNVFWVIK